MPVHGIREFRHLLYMHQYALTRMQCMLPRDDAFGLQTPYAPMVRLPYGPRRWVATPVGAMKMHASPAESHS